MEKYLAPLISALFVGAVTWVVNIASQALSGSDATITFGPNITVDERTYSVLEISNFKSTPLSSLVVEIPVDVNVQDAVLSSPAKLSAFTAPGTSSQLVTIDGVAGHTTLHVLLPAVDPRTPNGVGVRDTAGLSIEHVRYDALPPKGADRARDAIPGALLSAFLIFLVYLWFEMQESKRHRQLEARLADSKEERSAMVKQQDKLNADLDRIRQEVLSVRKSHFRERATVLRRLRDYSIELEFWRGTVRRAIGANSSQSRALFEAITSTLKTFGTQDGAARDFETITALAESIVESESKGSHA